MSSRMNRDKVDRLTALPTEIQVMIYEELLVADDLISVDAPAAANVLAIMQTSRQHHQAAETFYSKNEFLLTRHSTQPLGPIAPGYQHFLKKITISVCTGHPDLPTTLDKAQFIKDPAVAGLKLNQVSIDIRSDLHPMVVNRFDDSLLTRTHPITFALCFLIRTGTAKHLRIRLNAARFATGIVAILQKVFEEKQKDPKYHPEATLTFHIGSELVTENTKCERGVTGLYHGSPVQIGNFTEEEMTFEDIDDIMDEEEEMDATVVGMVTFAPELFYE